MVSRPLSAPPPSASTKADRAPLSMASLTNLNTFDVGERIGCTASLSASATATFPSDSIKTEDGALENPVVCGRCRLDAISHPRAQTDPSPPSPKPQAHSLTSTRVHVPGSLCQQGVYKWNTPCFSVLNSNGTK